LGNLILDTIDGSFRKVSTKPPIKWDAEFLHKSLLKTLGVNDWIGMCTLFDNLIRGMRSKNSMFELLSRSVKSTDPR
jgi:hypothetical protein